MKGSPVRVRASALPKPPLGEGFAFLRRHTLGACVKRLRQVDEVRDCRRTRGEGALPGFLRYDLYSRFFTGRSGADGERGPGGGQPSHTPHPGSGHRDSRDNQHSLHFGFGHSNRVWADASGCAPWPVRGAARATEGWLDIFNVGRRVSRIRVGMQNPGRSASAGRRDLSASSWLETNDGPTPPQQRLTTPPASMRSFGTLRWTSRLVCCSAASQTHANFSPAELTGDTTERPRRNLRVR